ncbi:SRPBCC family protein [Lysobacter auxotrophicus]|uniref:SRPBCC family protein n=1 Tax=Lysobacter auxotrophicus TaxID=2992573 RepID=A0ABM8DFR3_9GAMM|nr:SRPBCC family protein [Lysobacter auxotrophicus]BDU17414.1 SRPBCC family protein [Lysobacter auxotrophicus]
MWKIIAATLLVAIVAVLVVAATRPDTFRVERSIVVHAPPERVFEQVNDFNRWRAWSPFETLDPAMKREIAGTPCGVGAVYTWDGNSKAGAGRMEIVDSVPGEAVRIKLDFTRPMEAHNTAEFLIVPEGNGASRVTWAMHGPQPYIGKLISLVFSMDRMVGQDFERGLVGLKNVAERKGT